MATKIVEGFSISHAAILNGSTGAEQSWGDVYGVREGSIQVSTDSYDNTGDDAVLSTWYWFNYAEISVQGGYIPFDLISNLTGATITSSGVAPNDYYNLPAWNKAALNQIARPMLIRVPSKDSAGAVRTLDIILYKVQFQPFTFDGPSYKNGLLINYVGKALISSVDEAGNSIAGDPAIGRLRSTP